MAEAITIACPECEKKINVPADAVGKKIRCKGCEHVFVIEAPAAKKAENKPAGRGAAAKANGAKTPVGKAAAAKKAPDAKGDKAKVAKKADEDEDEDGNPYGVTSLDTTPRCPDCANELESADAVVCLHCGYNTQTRERASTRAVDDTTGLTWTLWLLPGILSTLAILILLTFDIWYSVKIQWLVGYDSGAGEWYELLGHPAIIIWLWIFSLFTMYPLGRFGVKRLILHPRPPERERKKKVK